MTERGLALRRWLLARADRVGWLGSLAPEVPNLAVHNLLVRLLAEKGLGLDRAAPLPCWSEKGTLRDWLRRRAPKRRQSDKKVVYFYGCVAQYIEPFLGKAAIALLEHYGYEVIVPLQNCCGLPRLGNGELTAALGDYQGNLARLAGFAHAGFPIIGTSSRCTGTLQHMAPTLLGLDNADTRQLSHQTWELFAWLHQVQSEGDLPMALQPLPLNALYHTPGQSPTQAVEEPTYKILERIPGLSLSASQPPIGKMAGGACHRAESYPVGGAVEQQWLELVRRPAQQVQLTVSHSAICRWQLEQHLGLPSRHPIELLAAAHGLYDWRKRALRPVSQ